MFLVRSTMGTDEENVIDVPQPDDGFVCLMKFPTILP